MATLYIAEYTGMGLDRANNVVPAACVPALALQAITISSTSAQSAAMNAQTAVVRLQADAACFVLWSTNPTATTSSMPLAANSPEYFTVPVGVSLKVAAITV